MKTLTPQEHDTEYLRLLGEEAQAISSLQSAIWSLNDAAGFRKQYRSRNQSYFAISKALAAAEAKDGERPWQRAATLTDAINEIHRLIAAVEPSEYSHYTIAKLTAPIETYDTRQLKLHQIRLQIRNLERGYTDWNRYFLVTSSSGLIHKSMDCSSCNKGQNMTQFALLPTLSGAAPSEAVDVLGPALCSICFRWAPTSWQDHKGLLPPTVTSVLLEKGIDAFRIALDQFNAKRAAKAAKAVK